jgi:hypothetical protein
VPDFNLVIFLERQHKNAAKAVADLKQFFLFIDRFILISL